MNKIIITTICLAISLLWFGSGFHNVDYCHNMMFLDINDTYNELDLNGNVWSFQDCYLTGLLQIKISVIVLIGLSAMIGYYSKRREK